MGVRPRVRIKWFRILVAVLAGYAVYICGSQHLQYLAVSREAEGSRMRLEQLQQVNQSMLHEKQQLSTTAYVEKLAREELGLVKPGEVPYVR